MLCTHYKALSQRQPQGGTSTMATFLATQGRYIVPMLPDGNCMFRSVVHQLVGDAEQHTQLRQATVAFTAQNGDTLKGYFN